MNKETKHTPGPWTIVPNTTLPDGTAATSILSPGLFPGFVCHCEGENREANAHLIAAGPDLLEACESAFRLLACQEGKLTENHKLAMNALRPAIKKAKGNPPSRAKAQRV